MDDSLRRPRTVTVAGLVALIACAVVATYLVVALGSLVTGDPPDGPDAAGAGQVRWLSAAFLAWTLAAAALAWFTLQGSSPARWLLLVSALLAGSVSLTATAYVPAALVPLVACVVTVSLLFGSSARAWFRAARA